MSFNKVDQSTGDLEQVAGAQNMVDYARLNADNNLTGVTTYVGKDSIHKNTSIDSDVTPSSMVIGNSVEYFRDTNGKTLGAIYTHQRTDGSIDLNIVTDATNTHNGKVLINGYNPIPIELYSHTSNNETWGDLIALVATEVAKHQNILGRLVIGLGGGQYRWQSGARWCMFESQNNGNTLSFFTIDLTNHTLFQNYFSVNGGMTFSDLTNNLTSGNVNLYSI